MRGLIFDLDGTLVDTVYAHVFAWQRAFAEAGLAIDGWRIHRRIGMSGGLFARAAARELGHDIDAAAAEDLQRRHGELFREFLPERRPLPGAVELLSGGYGETELLSAGAYRVYRDPAELLRSLDELGLEA